MNNVVYEATALGWNKFITQNPMINAQSFSEFIKQRLNLLIKKEISSEISSFNYKFISKVAEPELKLDAPCDLIITGLLSD